MGKSKQESCRLSTHFKYRSKHTTMNTRVLAKSQFTGARLAIKAVSRTRAASRMTTSAKVGLYFATSTGNTETAADWIQQKFSGDISDPTDIGEADISDLSGYDSLIVGAPTWNTGADEGRSGTAWDEVLEEIAELDLSGKKVAVFGCGDSSSYGDYFCDAIEEVYSTMKGAGATIDGKFCGLPLDEDNESDMTEDRIAAWCEQIAGE